jgi:putative transposase
MIVTFPKLVKQLLSKFPERDYSVLNTRLFVSCWLGFALDQSLQSMRDLFKRLNQGGKQIDISTFSKANQHRSLQPFQKLYQDILKLVKQKQLQGKAGRVANDHEICPIDSTVITLTSKLFWALGYHQVKLFSVFNNRSQSVDYPLIHFGQEHDYKFATQMTENLGEKQVGVMDRGFAALEYLKQLQEENKLFVIRINTNYKLEPLENGEWQVGTGKKQGIYRVVWFCDLEGKTEYRIVTNLPDTVSNEEIAEIYQQRWRIELFWKFLKMHLKLDRLISKSVNGITIQLYSCLIAYLILLLIEIPEMWGDKLLDKLRYLQGCMSQEFSYIHWIDRILHNRPIRLMMGAII